MERKTKRCVSRILALALAFALCLSMLGAAPGSSASSSGGTWVQVTSVDEIAAGGSFALVAVTDSGAKALDTSISSKIDGVDVTVSDNSLTGSNIPTWTVAPSGEGVSLTNGSAYLGYSSGTNFTKPDTAYAWNVSAQAESTLTNSPTTPPATSTTTTSWSKLRNPSPSSTTPARPSATSPTSVTTPRLMTSA